MRVGVYLGGQPPESGGGFTFTQEILVELAARAGSVSHEFVVLAPASSPRGAAAGALEIVNLGAAVNDLSMGWRIRLARAVDRFLGRSAALPTAGTAKLGRILDTAGLDLIWYLEPGAWLPVDIPYITIVWDLQHRLQPYFPEVGACGEFYLRNQVYAN